MRSANKCWLIASLNDDKPPFLINDLASGDPSFGEELCIADRFPAV